MVVFERKSVLIERFFTSMQNYFPIHKLNLFFWSLKVGGLGDLDTIRIETVVSEGLRGGERL